MIHWITFFIINIIVAIILHNCEDGKGPIKIKLKYWILWGLCSIIPYINVIIGTLICVIMIFGLIEEGISVREIIPKDSWLNKKY